VSSECRASERERVGRGRIYIIYIQYIHTHHAPTTTNNTKAKQDRTDADYVLGTCAPSVVILAGEVLAT
jgi:hypothetical protein